MEISQGIGNWACGDAWGLPASCHGNLSALAIGTWVFWAILLSYRSGLGWSLCCWCARSPAQGLPPSPGKRRRRKSRRLGGIEAILPHLWTSSVLLPWKAPWLLLLGKGIPFTGVTLFSYLSPQFDKTFCSRLWGPDVCDTQWYIAAGKNKCAVNWKTCLKKAQMGSTIASEVPLCESLM